MKISKEHFFTVGENLKIPPEKINALWEGLERKAASTAETTPFAKYLYYLGAMIIIGAMTWLITTAWDSFGGGGIFLISVIYGIIFLLLGSRLWKKDGMRIPAGLLITCAVCMAPLAMYGLEVYLKFFDPKDVPFHEFYWWVEGRWIALDIATIIAGALAIYFYPFPFLTAPIFCALWFLSLDIVPFFMQRGISSDQRAWISLFFGLALIVYGFVFDRRQKKDFAFWGYLFGTLSFWGGLNALVWTKGEVALFFYLIINLFMMAASIVLKRTVLMVFGAIGLFAYLSHLVLDLFQNSILPPFILSLMGLAIIYLGILFQKNRQAIESKAQSLFPWFKSDL